MRQLQVWRAVDQSTMVLCKPPRGGTLCMAWLSSTFAATSRSDWDMNCGGRFKAAGCMHAVGVRWLRARGCSRQRVPWG